MARQVLSPQTIEVYLAGVRHMQILIELPDPIEFTSMPHLRLVQAGIQRHVAEQGTNKDRIGLPITPAIYVLLQLHGHWIAQSANHDIKMIWAAAMICFFDFFWSGEITVPSITSFNPAVHLAWGDVSVDNIDNPTTLCIKLKKSKTDQFGDGVNVYVGKTDSQLCPVGAGLDYMAVCGSDPG